MLRESAIVYSSLPQEDGGVPSSSGTTVTTLPANGSHSRRDCQLTALITALAIVFGITLAVILPMALKNSPADDGRLKINPENNKSDSNNVEGETAHLEGANLQQSNDSLVKPTEENKTNATNSGNAVETIANASAKANNNSDMNTAYEPTTERPEMTALATVLTTINTTTVPSITIPVQHTVPAAPNTTAAAVMPPTEATVPTEETEPNRNETEVGSSVSEENSGKETAEGTQQPVYICQLCFICIWL